MALIKCTNCGATISDKAKFCPKCGSQVEHDNLIEETDEAPKRKKHYGRLSPLLLSLLQ